MAALLTKGEIRCYCDAPHCVATSYMCKSVLNACFTRVLDPLTANSPLTHGCLDLIGPSVDLCSSSHAGHRSTGSSALQCCYDDMCNYRGLHDLAHNKGEPSDLGSRHQSDGSRSLIAKVQELASAKEVWFRAAVIAVPIAGGLILALLVMLALRMLRSENHRLRIQQQQTLAHLHYSFHSKNAKKGVHLAKVKPACAAPLAGRDGVCLACDGGQPSDHSREGILSLVHWGVYSSHGKMELV
ncbi:BMP and activin membrane-bound inhibitor homolog [Arapaima gigas]